MGNKTFKKDGYIFNAKGAVIAQVQSDENKTYAVIAKCGHCGNGYFIPIMFTVYCKDVYAAIERVKAIPRVKRDQKDVILDAFEVSEAENIFIKGICDRDPFLLGYNEVLDPEVISRRIMHEAKASSVVKMNREASDDELKNLIRTSDMFSESMVLQRYYAPIIQGGKLIYPKNVNRKQLLDDYFAQNVLRFGVKKGNLFFLSVYYQLYGKNNPIGLTYDGGWFTVCGLDGKLHSFSVDDVYIEKLKNSGVFERDKQLALEEKKLKELEDLNSVKVPSALEKFNRRMAKFNDRNKQSDDKQSDDKQMGE